MYGLERQRMSLVLSFSPRPNHPIAMFSPLRGWNNKAENLVPTLGLLGRSAGVGSSKDDRASDLTNSALSSASACRWYCGERHDDDWAERMLKH